jgi:hypothetical protein
MNELLQTLEQQEAVKLELSPEEVDARFVEQMGDIQETPESLEARWVPARKGDGRNDPQREFQER